MRRKNERGVRIGLTPSLDMHKNPLQVRGMEELPFQGAGLVLYRYGSPSRVSFGLVGGAQWLWETQLQGTKS